MQDLSITKKLDTLSIIMDENQLILNSIVDGEDKHSAFMNCIRKNYRHMRKFAKRSLTDCFRIYDRQVHGFPLAIDYYAGKFCVHYFSPYEESAELEQELIQETTKALRLLFAATEDQIFWRTRVKSKLTRQYEKLDSTEEFFTVFEYGVKFKVNLVDYLDTGLFLDTREARRFVTLHSNSKRLLNLFAYTCSFSVHAAKAGAIFTKSVDMSNTYTKWGRDNFILNQIPLNNHEIVRADCLKFLDQETSTYDIIVIDPPTISRSKKMDQLFDIHVDYISLISKALKLLNSGGFIFFSTNSRKFVFDLNYFEGCKVTEITHKTLPPDFHDKKIHRSFMISRI